MNARYKTLRHMETVRNYLNKIIIELINRQEKHDQTKLESPEVEALDKYTEKLRKCTYGSKEYEQFLSGLGPALQHHYRNNRHHPEHFGNIFGMNLIDLIEMLCDWKAATLRHEDGNIYKSLEINKKRFNLSDDLARVLKNTIDFLEGLDVFHKAEES